MTANNFRIESYISPETYAKLRQFMEQNALTESKAIDVILTDYLGTYPTSSFNMESVSNLQVTSSPPVTSPNEGMTLVQLAQRLKCDLGQLERIRDYPVVFADYTKDRDPEGQAWEYDSTSQLYFPLRQ